MRYVGLAEELIKKNHNVTIIGKEGNDQHLPQKVQYINLKHKIQLLKAFLHTNVIILHGGGPILLSLSILSSFFNKSIILDSYVPHWIELENLLIKKNKKSRFFILIKSYINALRCLLGTLVFNYIIVANKRQIDLYRGMVAPYTLTHDFNRIIEIPFGCTLKENLTKANSRKVLNNEYATNLSKDDFIIGWLGGTYGWFDLEKVLPEISKSISTNPHIKIIFFGVNEERKKELLNFIYEENHKNVIFLPWVDFSKRFEYWAAFDLSLVWGESGYENDYASRTRNFDCLTISLPILQNEDDEWGKRLLTHNAGIVTDLPNLATELVKISYDPHRLKSMSQSMASIASDFYWKKFAEKIINNIHKNKRSNIHKLLGLTTFSFAFLGSTFMLIMKLIQNIVSKKQ